MPPVLKWNCTRLWCRILHLLCGRRKLANASLKEEADALVAGSPIRTLDAEQTATPKPLDGAGRDLRPHLIRNAIHGRVETSALLAALTVPAKLPNGARINHRQIPEQKRSAALG